MSPSFSAAAAHFGLNEKANFEDGWHLSVHKPIAELATELGVTEDEIKRQLEKARAVLLKQARDAYGSGTG